MFFEPPKGKTIDDIYNWCCETAEKLNRIENAKKKENNDGNDIRD